MSLNRYAKKRDANEPEIIEALEKAGATVHRIDVPCDLVIGFRGRNYLGEVKQGKAKLNKNQAGFMAEWRGQKPFVFRTVEDVIEWVNDPAWRTGMDI